jgi:heme A synthase
MDSIPRPPPFVTLAAVRRRHGLARVWRITRLTESGLSITEWKPISGAYSAL